MPIEVPIAIPEFMEAVFSDPEGTRLRTLHNGDLVPSDWKILRYQMRRDYKPGRLKVPWGSVIFVGSGCAIVYRHFGLWGLLTTGVVVWTMERIAIAVQAEVESRKLQATHAANSSKRSAPS